MQHREVYLMLCRDLNGKETEGRGDIRIHEADALYHAAEIDTEVQSYYAPIKKAPHQERRVASFEDKILDSPVQKRPSRQRHTPSVRRRS